MTIFNQPKSALQQWTVQYTVRGALDRSTPAPDATDAPKNEESVWTVDVPGALGIIDPDLAGGRASFGDRFITFIRIEPAVPFPSGFGLFVVDANLLVPSLGIVQTKQLTDDIAGDDAYTSGDCVTIPQGQALAIGPMAAPPAGTFHRITIGIRGAAAGDDEARLGQMCCCLNGGDAGGAGGGGGGGVSPIAPAYYDSIPFSSLALAVGDGFGDAYFRFGADYGLDAEEDTFNQSNGIVTIGEDAVTPSAIRMMTRAGSVSRLVIRSSAPFSYRWFVEIDSGGGFVRTFLMPAPVVLASNTTVIVDASSVVPYAAGDRVRSGLVITGNATADIQASLEFTQGSA